MTSEIVDVRIHSLSTPLRRTFWMSLEPYRAVSSLVVEIEAGDGTIGIGQAHGRPQLEIARIVRRLTPRLIGRDPLEHQMVWDELFRLSYSREGSAHASTDGQPHFGIEVQTLFMAALAAIDIALWDLTGKILHLPLFRLLGGGTNEVDAYASGGYYGEHGETNLEELLAEVQQYVDEGYRAVKIKVGGLPIADDAQRIAAVRSAFPSLDLMLDANAAYDLSTAIEASRQFEKFEIMWLEEPLAWFDPVFGLGRLGRRIHLPLASGEREISRFGCRDLVNHGGIAYLQFDCTRAGGITEWVRAAAYAEAHGVQMAPHHDPQVHAHLLSACDNGFIQEVFPNRVRDPFWAELFIERPQVTNGRVILSERPGLGLTVDPEAMDRFGTEVPV